MAKPSIIVALASFAKNQETTAKQAAAAYDALAAIATEAAALARASKKTRG